MRFATSLGSVFLTAIVAGAFAGAHARAARAADAAPPAALAKLLAKARAASGEPYRFHVVSRSHETQAGTTYDVTTEFAGLRYLAKRCAGPICSGFYFDGERSYDTNLNGTALPLSEAIDGLQVTLRAIASYAFAAPDFVKDGGTLVERGPILRDGKSYRRISVAPPLGATLDAIIDPATGLVDGVISDERKYAFEFKDQRRIGNGVTLPFAISLNGFTFTTFEARSISMTPLEPPPGLRPDFGSGNATVAIVKSARGAPVVPCTIGGQHATCALDTGNSGLSMSLALAKRLGLGALGGSFDAHGAGQYVAGVVKAPPTTIGNVAYPAAEYVVINALEDNGYDATLGADVFAHARIAFDFRAGQITIGPSEEAGGGLPIAFENFVPRIDVSLDGKPAALQVETADDGALELSSGYASAHPGLGHAASLRLGAFELRDQPIGDAGKLDDDGRLGAGVLRHFTATFDYEHASLVLTPVPGDDAVRAPGQ